MATFKTASLAAANSVVVAPPISSTTMGSTALRDLSPMRSSSIVDGAILSDVIGGSRRYVADAPTASLAATNSVVVAPPISSTTIRSTALHDLSPARSTSVERRVVDGGFVSDVTGGSRLYVADAPVTRSYVTDATNLGVVSNVTAGIPQRVTYTFADKSAEWEKLMGDVGHKHAEVLRGQWNIIREHLANFAQEIAAVRQDINTLRLADSQNEIHRAEVSRHVREMQAGFRQELVTEKATRQEWSRDLEARLEAAVSLSERAKREGELADNRLTKVSEALEVERREVARFVTLKGDITADVQTLARALEDQIRERGATDVAVKQAIRDLGDRFDQVERATESEIARLRSGVVEEFSSCRAAVEAVDRSVRADLDLMSSGHSELKDHVLKTSRDLEKALKQESMAREELRKGHSAALANFDTKLSEHKSNLDRRATLERVEELVERRVKDPEVTSGHISTLERKLKDELAALSGNMRDSHSDIKEQMRKLKDETARGGRGDISTSFDTLHAKTTKDLADHKSMHNEHRGRLDDLERRLSNQWTSEQHKAHVSSVVDAIERRLSDEHNARHSDHKEQLMNLSREHNAHRAELRDYIAKASAQHKHGLDEVRQGAAANVDAIESKLRAELGEHRASIHDALQEQLSQERQARDRAHTSITNRIEEISRKKDGNSDQTLRDTISASSKEHQDRLTALETRVRDNLAGVAKESQDLYTKHATSLDELERKIRRDFDDHKSTTVSQYNIIREQIGKERQDREVFHSTANTALNALDRKLRDELSSTSNDQHNRHSELKILITKESNERYAELQDAIAKVAQQERSAREDYRSSIATALESLEGKMRREVSSDRGYTDEPKWVREQLNQERQVRERGYNALLERLTGLERRCDTPELMNELLTKERAFMQSQYLSIRDSISKPDLERVLRRMWEVISTHTYNLAALSNRPVASTTAVRLVQDSVPVTTTAPVTTALPALRAPATPTTYIVPATTTTTVPATTATQVAYAKPTPYPTPSYVPSMAMVQGGVKLQEAMSLPPQAPTMASISDVYTRSPIIATRSISPMPVVQKPITSTISSVGTQVVPRSTYVFPRAEVDDVTARPLTTVTTVSGQSQQPPPMAVAGLDLNHDGRTDVIVMGADRNRDGIPDVLQQGQSSAVATIASTSQLVTAKPYPQIDTEALTESAAYMGQIASPSLGTEVYGGSVHLRGGSMAWP